MNSDIPPVPYRSVVQLLALRAPAPISAETVARGYGLSLDLAQKAIVQADTVRFHARHRGRAA
ncbi:hypothetical protein [Sandarakinorhabdus sp. DWP1-3-1]|uniref:hypothetical protein n=1 Tax=Sandarakinorhabdus sp. DWP1-3-1 TaxID=2804627 RepID=UPI003CFA4739